MDGASGSDGTDATSTSTPIVKTGNVQNVPSNLIILKDKISPMEAVKEGKGKHKGRKRKHQRKQDIFSFFHY